MNKFARLENFLTQSTKIQEKTILYLFRHAQSVGNHAGSIVGWTDSKLSIRGREDASKLYQGLHKNIKNFTQFHSSDLSRTKETLNICTGFSGISPIYTEKLRELHFGDEEGAHYDSMTEERKKIINSIHYEPPNGETWPQARERAMNYIKQLEHGHHFIVTHGGLICALTYHLGVTDVIPNCSMICAEFSKKEQDLIKVSYKWNFNEE